MTTESGPMKVERQKRATKSDLGMHVINLYIQLSRKFYFYIALPTEHSMKMFNHFTYLKEAFEMHTYDF